MNSSINFTYIIQIASALVIASVIYRYFLVYQREYLKDWAYSFAALLVFLSMALIVGEIGARTGSYTTPLMVGLALIKLNAGYLQISWLILGTYKLFKPNGIVAVQSRMILIITVSTATIVALLYSVDPEGGVLRNTLRNGSRYFLGGLAFMVSAAFVFLHISKQSTGKVIVGTAFLLYGIEMAFLGYLNLQIIFGASWQLLASLVPLHGIFELLIYPTIGLGLVIWLLEHERHKAQLIYNQLANIHHSDPLTGLSNRTGFEIVLRRWAESYQNESSKIIVVLLGIDQFKRINQSVGVRGGDEVLVALANRLNDKLGTFSAQARLSGDVFACVLKDDMANIARVNWLLRLMAKPLFINKQSVHIDVSIGATWMTSNDDIEDTLLKAQRALEYAKQKGGKKALMFDASMPENKNTLELENELRCALEKKQFEIFLQPIMGSQNQQIGGFEILSRWNHPERGHLPPFEFLPHLAQLQLMPKFDLWTLQQAVKLLRTWRSTDMYKLTLAVNLSAEGLQDDYYLENAPDIIKSLGSRVHLLYIEVTENSAMKSINAGKSSLNLLHDLGAKISLDDFGTGYSSLNYLKSFPADKVKFDRSFILEMSNNEATRTILKSLVPLCQKLGKKVVAEGIETHQQLELAHSIGFDQIQGYYYAQPMAVTDAIEYVQQPNRLKRAQ